MDAVVGASHSETEAPDLASVPGLAEWMEGFRCSKTVAARSNVRALGGDIFPGLQDSGEHCAAHNHLTALVRRVLAPGLDANLLDAGDYTDAHQTNAENLRSPLK